MDGDVNRGMRSCGSIHCLQEHGALMLVEEFWCLIDVVVGSGVGSAHDHDS